MADVLRDVSSLKIYIVDSVLLRIVRFTEITNYNHVSKWFESVYGANVTPNARMRTLVIGPTILLQMS